MLDYTEVKKKFLVMIGVIACSGRQVSAAVRLGCLYVEDTQNQPNWVLVFSLKL